MWAGIAGTVTNNGKSFEVAISIHDSVYNTDFASSTISYNANDPETQAAEIEKHVLDILRKFSTEHLCKFLGAGVTVSLLREVRLRSPLLQSVLGMRVRPGSYCSRNALLLRVEYASAFLLVLRRETREGPG